MNEIPKYVISVYREQNSYNYGRSGRHRVAKHLKNTMTLKLLAWLQAMLSYPNR